MKILHVTKKFPPLIGGDASVVSNLVKIQSKKNSVFVLTSNCGQTKSKNILKFGMKAKSKDLDNISIKRIMSLFLLFIKSFYILKKIQPKIIHVHSIDLAFAISLSSKLLNIPLICTLHGTTFNKKEINYFKRILDKMLIRFSLIDKISVVDKTSLINFSTNHVKYVPNGIDTSLFKPIKNKIKNKKQIKLLSVGRLEKIKGFDLLVDVVNKHEEFTLTLVGDGPIKRKLIKKAKRKIFFKGEIKNKNLPGIYQSHEVFILPLL